MTVLVQIKWLLDEYSSFNSDNTELDYFNSNMHYGVCFKLNELRDRGEDILPLKKVLFQYVGSEDNKTWLCPTILTKDIEPKNKPIGDYIFEITIQPRNLMLAELLVQQIKKHNLLN